jgi:hypothetical protein
MSVLRVFARVVEVHVRWRLRVFAVGFDEAGLEVDDVFAERVVFGLDGFVVVLQSV